MLPAVPSGLRSKARIIRGPPSARSISMTYSVVSSGEITMPLGRRTSGSVRMRSIVPSGSMR